MSAADVTGPVVHLHAAGVSLVLECTGDRLPAIVHWGRELPGLDAAAAAGLVASSVQHIGPNALESPVRPTLVPEAWSGWLGRPGLRAARAGRDWSTRFVVTSVTVGDSPVQGYADAGPARVEVRAVDEGTAVSMLLEVELLPTGLVRSRASVTNEGDATEPLAVEDLVLAYPVPGEAGELLDLGGRWGLERQPQRTSFVTGTHVRENRRGRTGADSAYLLHAGVPGFGFASGEVWAVHVAWSGNHTHYAERTNSGESLLGGGELLMPGEVRLDPGGSYSSPWLYGGYADGLDALARRFHAHLRSRDRAVGPDRPVTLNVWEAVYFDHDADRLVDLAERAAALGVERFVLDDGWFGSRRDDRSGLGDWVVSPEVWPNGLDPLVDRVVGLGMQFGLWFEPEMVNADSDVARAHPDWVMSARAEWPVESRFQQVLDLSNPDAYAHVRDQVAKVLRDNAIGYVKWDHNRDLVESGSAARGGRAAVHAQTEAFYRLLDELRGSFPEVEFESCASGGARVDLGVLERADRVWVSDNIDPHDRQLMLRWSAQLIPPEFMGSHIASGRSHTTRREHDLRFRAATAVFGHLGIEWDLASATEEELAQLRPWLEFFKAERGLLLAGDLVRMDGFDDDVLVHGVLAPDRSRAVFAHVVLDGPSRVPGPRLRFRGLQPDRAYAVRPLLVGGLPAGTEPPPWWGTPATAPAAGGYGHVEEDPVEDPGYPGVVVTGATLAGPGLAAAWVRPDQAVLFLAEAL